MIHKCSIIRVMEIFFKEPTSIHFIREISRKIKLAPTSVRNNLKDLERINLIVKKKANPFDGYFANREDSSFIFYKKAYNLYTLYELKEFLIEKISPNSIVVFGSYSRGEDIESSDIDILIISKINKKIGLSNFENKLKRKINVITLDNLNKLDEKIQKKVRNGFTLYGEI